ncbi:response regulator [Muricoccus radiodurans]|uniref:response regulator n=1 Tax=Muricoccus radiodurans TaxID=2231721 RepID=UPI003CE7BDE6
MEDDLELRKLLLQHLRRGGFRATGAQDGAEMRRLRSTTALDLVLLDVMLPGRSGFDLLRELRLESGLPVIILTAMGETTDRVTGLELGADDFMVKPVDPRELIARIHAVLRRMDGVKGKTGRAGREVARFDGWALDTRRRELFRPDGVGVELTAGEYDVLLAFVERPLRILSRLQLLDIARSRAFGGLDRSIDVQISRLRIKLGGSRGDDSERALIKTVRGAGYMLASEVEWS